MVTEYPFNNLGRDVGQIANLPYIQVIEKSIISIKRGKLGCARCPHTPQPPIIEKILKRYGTDLKGGVS